MFLQVQIYGIDIMTTVLLLDMRVVSVCWVFLCEGRGRAIMGDHNLRNNKEYGDITILYLKNSLEEDTYKLGSRVGILVLTMSFGMGISTSDTCYYYSIYSDYSLYLIYHFFWFFYPF